MNLKIVAVVAVVLFVSSGVGSAQEFGKRPLGRVLDVWIWDGHAYALSSAALYRFDPSTPSKWEDVAAVQHPRAVAGGGKEFIFLIMEENRGGLMKPALFSWKWPSVSPTRVCDLPSEACSFISDSQGSCVSDGKISLTWDGGKTWEVGKPIFKSKETAANVIWISDKECIVTSLKGEVARCKLNDHELTAIWNQDTTDHVAPVVSFKNGKLWLLEPSLVERNWADGAIISKQQLAQEAVGISAMDDFIATWNGESIAVFPIRDKLLADVMTPAMRPAVHAIENSKKECWVISEDGTMTRVTSNLRPAEDRVNIECDNGLFDRLKQTEDAANPTKEQLDEFIQLGRQLPPDALLQLMKTKSQQPGTNRDQFVWVIAELRRRVATQATTQPKP